MRYDPEFPDDNERNEGHPALCSLLSQITICIRDTGCILLIDWLCEYEDRFAPPAVESFRLFLTTVPANSEVFCLTLIPSNRDKALSGLRALNVLRDLMAPSSE